MPQVNVCIVGAGRAGALHARNITQYVPGAKVTGVVDPEAAVAEALAAETGAEGAFATLRAAREQLDLDAVVISTPTFTHHELAVEAFEQGMHVFCEKPLALSVAECDEMIAAAAAADRALRVGFVRRFQAEFREARERIAGGSIGEPMLIKSLTRGPGLPPAWANDVSLSNGMLAEVNSHDFDSVRWLAGSDIARVYAEVANRKGARLGVPDPDFYDNAVVTLRLNDGTVGTIDGTCPAEYGYDARVEVVGTEGALLIGGVHGMSLVEAGDRDRGAVRPVHRTWPERFSWGYVDEIREFIAVAAGEGPAGEAAAGATGEDGRQAVAAVVAANRSWREEAPVSLADAVDTGTSPR